MADASFDIEAGVDRQEVDNAINQAAREVSTRFDFKDTNTIVEWAGDTAIRIQSATEDRARAALEVLRDKLVKRKVSLKAVDAGEPQESGGGASKIDIALRDSMPGDVAKAIVKQIKDAKLKISVTNMGERVRVSSKSKDILQDVIAMVKKADYDAPLRFTNYR